MSDFQLQRQELLPRASRQRIETELRRVVAWVQRELIRVGVLPGPARADWKLEEGIVPLHHTELGEEAAHRAVVVYYAGLAVEATCKALLNGRVGAVRPHGGKELILRGVPRYAKYSAISDFYYRLHRSSGGTLSLATIAEVTREADLPADASDDERTVERGEARRRVQQRVIRFRRDNPNLEGATRRA